MRKRLLTVLLAVILVIALGTITAFADDAYVSNESELREAISNASSGDTVVLTDDITVTDTINIENMSITLDLAGHVIQNNLNGVPRAEDDNIYMGRVFHVFDGASLTVDGTTDNSGMSIAESAVTNGFFAVDMGGNLTLNGGSYSGSTDTYYANEDSPEYFGNMIGVYDQVEGIVKNSTISLNYLDVSTNYAFLDTLDTIRPDNLLTVNVTGGTYTGMNRMLFHVDSYSLCPANFDGVTAVMQGPYPVIELDGSVGTFDNCNFEVKQINSNGFSHSAIFVGYDGLATVNSGIYTSVGVGLYIGTTGGQINVFGGTVSGGTYAAVADEDNTTGSACIINIYDGRINGQLKTSGDNANIIVSGGTFSQAVDTEFCAPGFVSIKNEDETYGVSLNPDSDLVAQIVNNSGHVIAAYENLSDATSRLTSGQTLQLLDDITNNDVETQRIYLPENAVLDGDGHTISGNVAVYANASGGIIEDVTFEDIHNSSNNLSAVYAPGLAGKLSITNCIFDNCDWDAIQITPIAGADISITGNTFSTDNADGIYQVRYVHIQSGLNVDFTATVTDNVMYDQIKGVNGAGADCGALEIYYFADPSKINASHNYIQYPELNCILATRGINVGEMAYPMYLDDELTQLSGTPVAAIKSGYTGTYFMTIEEALAAAEAGETVQFLTGTAGTGDITITLITGFTNDIVITNQTAGTSVELPELARSGYVLRGWSDGETTYRAGESYKVVEDATLTAVWGTSPNIPDTYPITIADTDNGTVSTNLTNASAGATITITAEPDEGYSVGRVVVTGPDGRLDVTRVNATTYTFKMPEGDVEVEVEFVSGEEALPFTDVTAGAWYYDAVSYVYFNGMMEGDSATTFNPDGTMTRAMFWAVLGRIDGASITGSNWAEAAREWAVTNGVSDGENASGLVTREQMVTMLWRYVGEPESSYSLSAYSDAASVSDWAEEAMSWALENGIIEGMTATTLEPQSTATRAQCATIFMRYDALEA